MTDFFISYNRNDRQWAEWIGWQLEQSGSSIVIRAWDIRPGMNFAAEMKRAAECERTVAVLSPDYLASEFAQTEWLAAFTADPRGGRQKLVPVRIRECELTGLDAPLVYIDLVGKDKEESKTALLEGITIGRVKPDVEPDFPNEPPDSAGNTGRTIEREPGFPGKPIRNLSIPRVAKPLVVPVSLQTAINIYARIALMTVDHEHDSFHGTWVAFEGSKAIFRQRRSRNPYESEFSKDKSFRPSFEDNFVATLAPDQNV